MSRKKIEIDPDSFNRAMDLLRASLKEVCLCSQSHFRSAAEVNLRAALEVFSKESDRVETLELDVPDIRPIANE